ncbi:hypothetical protein FZEAL_4879 [Fusarium zealandicum]|uniref:Proteophosphoglycan ppg4 n=1 Tax=Fusarium zealandicum TaxID=1053134 RepID=A0A8H4ULC5_9HYPO|nr:hypothetical protein FZEAL_4879 [Fusarium zealandicum]
MGNIQSAEAPRRHRKLSKPPVGTQTSAAGLPYNATAVTPHHEHFSSSYLAGSLSPSTKKTSSSRTSPAGIGIAVPVGGHASPLASPTCRYARRESTQRNGVLRSQSTRSEQSPKIPSFVNGSSASSIVQYGGHPSIARAESLPIVCQRGSARYDARASESQKLVNTKPKPSSEPIITKLASNSESSQDVTDNIKNGNQSASTPISRTNSDVSLYMPMRRRSVIQTPGIATRAHHSNTPISTKSSFRNSHPPSPSHTRHSSIESDLVRRMSAPSIQPVTQPQERVATPTEVDYRQLGGIKFGSLRITNGAPMATPVLEDDAHKGVKVSESRLESLREGYFEHESDPGTLASTRLNVAKHKEPVTTRQPVTMASVPVAEHLSKAGKSRTCEGEMSESGNADSFPVAEALNIREDANAKPGPERIRLELENKTLKGLTRTDSGFIPSPSSESVRQTVSKVDSGYSSNVSLRSLPSMRSAVTDKSTMASENLDTEVTGVYSASDSNSTRTSSLAPSQTHGRLPTHLEVPSLSTDDDVSTCPTSPASPSSRTFSFARGSRTRLLSLRSARSYEFRTSKQGANPALVPIILTDDQHALEQLPSPPSSAGRGGSKLYRFLNGSRNKGPPKVRGVRTIEKEVPASPSDVDETRSELLQGLQPLPQTSGLRAEPSKDTLRTILSVGSQDLSSAATRQNDDISRDVQQSAPKKISRRQSWRQSIAHMFGSRSPSTGPVAPKEAETALKRPVSAIEQRNTAPSKATRNSHTTVARTSRHVPKRSVSSSDSLASPTRRTATKPGSPGRRDKPELAHLRTNLSSPNLSEARHSPLNPSHAEQVLQMRATPPVSMQTRSTKPSRGKPKGHSRSTTPAYPVTSSRAGTGRRLSLPQDLGRSTLHSRHSSHAPQSYSEPQSPSWGMAMSPVMSPQQLYAVQQPRALSYSSTGGQQAAPAASQSRQRRRVSAPAQGLQTSSVPQSRSTTTLLQQQQQQQQHHQFLQAWMPVDAYHLSQQLQQNYMLQNQGMVYGAPNLMQQQYPDVYITRPAPTPSYHAHGRASSQGTMYGHNPPFRVLHSYNSPAYRGTPIWG